MTFDDVASVLSSPMVVVTTVAGDARAGCLVGFHCQSSIDPPRYAVWISRANHTLRVAAFADVFAVHFLRDTDRALAVLFGTTTEDEIDKFAKCDWHAGPDGVPLLDGCPTRIVGRKHVALDDGGDHVGFVLTPVSATLDAPHRPLMLSEVRDLDAGHDPAERQLPPS